LIYKDRLIGMKLEQKIMKERTDQMHQKVRNGKNGKSEY